jgi:Arc/MetJ-type ribon-helix-helix transcriptional regulator
MKLSVSLADEDVAFLDHFVEDKRFESRSAVLQRAVQLLRSMELASAYEAAWDEWAASDDAAMWERATGDGIE